MEDKIRRICAAYGFDEIRTPMFEETGLFLRGIGETTDVVQKEMYTFPTGDKKEQTYTLRPENTASAVRAYLENKVYGQENLTKWFYIGPMFRHDKPQAGRYRQFHQFGVEVLGTQAPATDAEVILMVLQLFNDFGLKDLSVQVNSVGCPNCRPAYREKLIAFFEPKKINFAPDCQLVYIRTHFAFWTAKKKLVKLYLSAPLKFMKIFARNVPTTSISSRNS